MSLIYAEKLSYREDVGTVGMTEIFEPLYILQRKRLPPAFVKHNVIDPSQGAQLKGPNGRIWYVQLNIRGIDTYLQDGWKKFVEDHSLKAY
ncbi:hypothetical protein MRB53_021592 [Persea americana]|uniref:Uncharacterized protein n=1 Tax=Persea americana TaxID=3435 RepID=A0ACC2L4M8_PERAE|nr:hypothetical protein MRB53_021592 [Persea americana]